jgi:hypothetical protein
VLEFECCNFELPFSVLAVSEDARINDATVVNSPLPDAAIGEIESGIEEEEGDEEDGDGDEDDGEEDGDDGVTLRPD